MVKRIPGSAHFCSSLPHIDYRLTCNPLHRCGLQPGGCFGLFKVEWSRSETCQGLRAARHPSLLEPHMEDAELDGGGMLLDGEFVSAEEQALLLALLTGAQAGPVSSVQQQASKSELFPDPIELFRFYNLLYFDGALDFCSVEWSTGRMTLCAGVCEYRRGGGCRIKLSEPLLKLRPVKDLKETLLHEMIHAYMFLKGIRDRSDHGPIFQAKMKDINAARCPDPHRPPEGYNITVYHTMHAEVEHYRKHWWQCRRCSNVVKRAMNRPPQEADCSGRSGRGAACRDDRCLWHTHLRNCGGEYDKIKSPDPPAPSEASKKLGRGQGTRAPGTRAVAASNRAAKAAAGTAAAGGAAGAGGGKGSSERGVKPITSYFHAKDTAGGTAAGAAPAAGEAPRAAQQSLGVSAGGGLGTSDPGGRVSTGPASLPGVPKDPRGDPVPAGSGMTGWGLKGPTDGRGASGPRSTGEPSALGAKASAGGMTGGALGRLIGVLAGSGAQGEGAPAAWPGSSNSGRGIMDLPAGCHSGKPQSSLGDGSLSSLSLPSGAPVREHQGTHQGSQQPQEQLQHSCQEIYPIGMVAQQETHLSGMVVHQGGGAASQPAAPSAAGGVSAGRRLGSEGGRGGGGDANQGESAGDLRGRCAAAAERRLAGLPRGPEGIDRGGPRDSNASSSSRSSLGAGARAQGANSSVSLQGASAGGASGVDKVLAVIADEPLPIAAQTASGRPREGSAAGGRKRREVPEGLARGKEREGPPHRGRSITVGDVVCVDLTED